MSRSVIRRLEALEKVMPSDLVIYAETTDGQRVEAKVKDVIDANGALNDGYAGIGSVVSGKSNKDVDAILAHLKAEAEKDVEQ